MSSFKLSMYDWEGYNWILSQKIHLFFQNKFAISTLHMFSKLVSNICFFPIHIILLSFVVAWLIHKHKYNQLAIAMFYMKHFCLLLVNISIGMLIVKVMKEYFQYPRPFCTIWYNLNEHMMYFLNRQREIVCGKGDYAFPSGHAAYVLLFVTSFWGTMNPLVKKLSSCVVVVIMASRVILGYHFLADVVYACLIPFLSYPLSRLLVTHYFAKYEPMIRQFLKARGSKFLK